MDPTTASGAVSGFHYAWSNVNGDHAREQRHHTEAANARDDWRGRYGELRNHVFDKKGQST